MELCPCRRILSRWEPGYWKDDSPTSTLAGFQEAEPAYTHNGTMGTNSPSQTCTNFPKQMASFSGSTKDSWSLNSTTARTATSSHPPSPPALPSPSHSTHAHTHLSSRQNETWQKALPEQNPCVSHPASSLLSTYRTRTKSQAADWKTRTSRLLWCGVFLRGDKVLARDGL